MRQTQPPIRRLLGLTTALSMALPGIVQPALAQDADSAAPPARVGQINALTGSVSFNGSGSGGWAAAANNYPVTSGDSIYTQDSARAGIALDASQITLSSDTEMQVTDLDDSSFAGTLSQGEAAFAIADLQPGQSYNISTPRGTVAISQNGQYDIIAGDANEPTLVNVFQGQAVVTAPGANLTVAAGQAGVLSGASQTVAQLGQAQQDSFSSAVLVSNIAPPPAYAPAVCNQMTGVTELSQYGGWQQSPQYGAVWYPTVSAGWAPYREGHWADIQPWGWTWVESEPWGFAPFHYGRWIDDGGRWGWAPAPAYGGGYGYGYRPVYAPAVVGFFGLAVGIGITAALLSSGSVGWVPLAPGEAYYPTYRASPAYIRQINYVNVRNINDVHITNNYYYGDKFSPDRLANRRGATFVQADVMSRGERVAGYAHTPAQDELAAARPVDTGFGHPAGHAAGFGLPEASRPLAELRPAAAPHPSAFAIRRTLPPATVSHAPFTGRPEAPAFARGPGGAMPAANRPAFATVPGFHAPPPPPAPGAHLASLPPAPKLMEHLTSQAVHPGISPSIHPEPEQQHPGAPAGPASRPPAAPPQPASPPAPEAYHPATPAPAYHPPAEAYHPAAPARPAAPAYHPPAPAYHPPAPAYHPPAPAYHPPAPQPRPAPPASQPRPAPPAPRPAPPPQNRNNIHQP